MCARLDGEPELGTTVRYTPPGLVADLAIGDAAGAGNGGRSFGVAHVYRWGGVTGKVTRLMPASDCPPGSSFEHGGPRSRYLVADKGVGRMSERDGVVIGADDRRIGFLERGPADGTKVLYLHGMPASRHEQRFIPEAVLDRFGVRLVSCDRPGYGATDPHAGNRIARSQDVLTVADHLGVEQFPLMAASAGASYAVTVAATAPGRVERLVLSGGQMPYDDERAVATMLADQLTLLPFLSGGRNDLVDAGAADFRAKILADPWSLFASSWSSLSAPERAFLEQPEVRTSFERDVVEGVQASAEGLVDDLLAWPQPYEISVGDVCCPVVAVHGASDDWEPLANLRRVGDLISNFELIVLEGRNHLGPLLLPDLLVSLAVRGATPVS